MPKVSIIIPVYNTAPWLEECLDSAVNQTFRDLEIICVDDASTDVSPEILRFYAERDERISILTLEKNAGQAYARNIGMSRACGDYIYFLDSDDSITKDAIQRLYDVSSMKETDIVFFDANSVYEAEELKKKHRTYIAQRKASEYTNISNGVTLFLSFQKNNEWIVETPRQFYSVQFLKQNHFSFQEGFLREDVWFSNQCIFAAQKVAYIPDQLFNRRFREQSTMTSKVDARHFWGEFSAAVYTNQFAHQNGLYEDMKPYIAKLNNRAIAIYEACKADVKVKGLQDSELINAFYLFESQQDNYCAYGELSDALLERARQYEQVFIYGAGVVAKSVYAGLIRNQIPIDGFIVTSSEGNPKVLEGHRVYAMDEIAKQTKVKKKLIIVAMLHSKQQIGQTLDQLHMDHLDYDEG